MNVNLYNSMAEAERQSINVLNLLSTVTEQLNNALGFNGGDTSYSTEQVNGWDLDYNLFNGWVELQRGEFNVLIMSDGQYKADYKSIVSGDMNYSAEQLAVIFKNALSIAIGGQEVGYE